MIEPKTFYLNLKKAGIEFFTGVPDSLLANICAYIEEQCSPREHIITANEGNAIALAAGYHLSTGKVACVYMQNSGLGNAINPLTSLTDSEVYRIPVLMIIGWRGEPGVRDEPQHIKQGRITPGQLDLLEIPYHTLHADSDLETTLSSLLQTIAVNNSPAALLVHKNTFSNYKIKHKSKNIYTLKREQALRSLLSKCTDELIITTTGKTSREVYELRSVDGVTKFEFLTVGSMGHAASIALGVALGNPRKNVICIDGDGSILMHLGALPIIGNLKPHNLIHVLLNNSAHESVGGQATVAGDINFNHIAIASGYRHYYQATNTDEIIEAWSAITHCDGPIMLEIKIGIGSREDLGRPKKPPEENKNSFMRVAKK